MLLRNSRNDVFRRAFCALVLCLYLAGFFPAGVVSGFGPGEAEAAVGDPWDGTVASGFAGGDGSAATPYLIETAEQLAFLAQRVNSNDLNYRGKEYKLTADIDLGGSNALQWTPIGIGDGNLWPATNYFAGVFDGDGHVVIGMRIVDDNYFADGTVVRYAGLFGFVSGDVSGIKNVGVTDFVVSVDRSAGVIYAGGLVGYLRYGSITSSYSRGEVFSSSADDIAYAGGLAGYVRDSSITSSYATGPVASSSATSFSSAGGLAAFADNSSITSSYAMGEVFSSSSSSAAYIDARAGGLVGTLLAGSITSSYATGDVDGIQTTTPTNALVGGLVGMLDGRSVDLTTSYAWGAVSGNTGANLGGLIGLVYSNVSADKVKSNDWRQDTAGTVKVNENLEFGIGDDRTTQSDGPINQTAHTTSHDKAAFGIASRDYFEGRGWDFADTWCYTELDGNERPHLQAFFESDTKIINAKFVNLSPGKMTISTGETKQARLYAGGWDIDSGSVTVTPSSFNGVVITPHPTSPDVIVLVASGDLTPGETVVSVDYKVNGHQQTRKSFTLTVALAADVEKIILDATPEDSRAELTAQPDGSYAVDIYIPFDASFDPALIESIYVDALNITIVRVHWVDEDGIETVIPIRRAGQHELHIEGTVADRHTLADVVIRGIYFRLKNDTTNYVQHLDMKLSEIPGGRLADGSSGGVGCTTGAGVFALIGLGVVLRRRPAIKCQVSDIRDKA